MESDEFELEDEAKTEVHQCETCGVGQYFQAVKMAGGDWQGIVYETCLPCKHNQMTKMLGPLIQAAKERITDEKTQRALDMVTPSTDNWCPKKPIQGVDLKDALKQGLLAGFRKGKD